MTTIDDEWMQFMSSQTQFGSSNISVKKPPPISAPIALIDKGDIEEEEEEDAVTDELYISTKTKVLYLNQEIDIDDVFWKIPIIDYGTPKEGVVQKQMKVVSKTPEEFEVYQRRLEGVSYYKEHVIKQINNPSARRIKFKDERKITIGVNKKDIMNCRGKVKNAFYNCFAVYIRFSYLGAYKEIHVKIFNTGKLEIPGILNVELLDTVKRLILQYIGPYIVQKDADVPLTFNETDKDMVVLINSNFNCGYYINRDKLYSILRSEKYGIEAAYEPCSYPGVKCKYYFNNEVGMDGPQTGCISKTDRTVKLSELNEMKKYTEVSFMIFRTGSGLIVGNCSDIVLDFIFGYIKRILETEYTQICCLTEKPATRNKAVKSQKRNVMMTQSYHKLTLALDMAASVI